MNSDNGEPVGIMNNQKKCSQFLDNSFDSHSVGSVESNIRHLALPDLRDLKVKIQQSIDDHKNKYNVLHELMEKEMSRIAMYKADLAQLDMEINAKIKEGGGQLLDPASNNSFAKNPAPHSKTNSHSQSHKFTINDFKNDTSKNSSVRVPPSKHGKSNSVRIETSEVASLDSLKKIAVKRGEPQLKAVHANAELAAKPAEIAKLSRKWPQNLFGENGKGGKAGLRQFKSPQFSKTDPFAKMLEEKKTKVVQPERVKPEQENSAKIAGEKQEGGHNPQFETPNFKK